MKVRLLALGNLLAALAALILNALANILPINGRNTGEISDSIPNLFVPAGLTFSIWGLIYLLMIAFVVYQAVLAFSDSEEKQKLVARTGPWFILLSLANALWILAWHYGHVALSMLLMLLLLGSLIKLYLNVHPTGEKSSGAAETVCIRVMSGVYLGWITVATVANATALLVTLGLGQLWPGEVAWTVIVIAAAVAIGVLMLVTRRDASHPLVVTWALLGIVLKRLAATPAEQAIVIAASLGGLVLLVMSIRVIVLGLMKKA